MGSGVTGILTIFLCLGAAKERQPPRPTQYEFEATAYSLEGKTKDGRGSRVGVVAADPKVLPLGTQVQLTGAGLYSGTYLVADTGRKVKGTQIDVYVPDSEQAKRFGRRTVRVRVLKWGRR